MSEVIEISESLGEELKEYEDSDESVEVQGHSYTFFDRQYNYDDHRWNTTDLFVFKRDDGKLFGMEYDYGKTESQESGFVYCRPCLVEVTREERTVVTVSYREVPKEAEESNV